MYKANRCKFSLHVCINFYTRPEATTRHSGAYLYSYTYIHVHACIFVSPDVHIPVYMHANVQFLLHYDTKLRGCREQMLVASAP